VPHIPLKDGIPGISSLMAFRPETAGPLSELAEVLLRGPSPLSRGERELIAAFVSSGNECRFCRDSHSATAGLQLSGGRPLVDAVTTDHQTADISPKLKALLTIADLVRESGRSVTAEAVAQARSAGASDVELHDTVLIASAFCMYNRYVDGLATSLPADPQSHDRVARRIVEEGYTAPGEGRQREP
jgi:uncharacterized peroxidase-related enzyme